MEEMVIRRQLVKHLIGGQAAIPLKDIVEVIPFEQLGQRPAELPYSFYELFYHIRFAQKDILDYCSSNDYTMPSWPADYWPEQVEPDSEEQWRAMEEGYFQEREAFIDVILDENNDLLRPVLNSRDHSLLREIMLVVEHTAYHTGQLLLISRLLGVYS